jgi:hypothetical protein
MNLHNVMNLRACACSTVVPHIVEFLVAHTAEFLAAHTGKHALFSR